MTIPFWAFFVLVLAMVLTHIGVFLAGVASTLYARKVAMAPIYRAKQPVYGVRKPWAGKHETVADAQAKSEQFAYLDALRNFGREQYVSDDDGKAKK